ncbi:MAG: hypothetical protein ACFFDS_00750 [Candidatus Thorarchaeota archaeon]
MRIRDKVYVEDWKQTIITDPSSKIIAYAHHLFGALAIILIVVQSAITLNIFVFSLWLVLGIVIVLLDFFSANHVTLKGELGYGIMFVLGTVVSLMLGNVNSMFFPDTLGRIDIILFQVSAGLCISLRFLIAFFYIEFFTQEYEYIIPQSSYSKEQIKLYKENLTKTNFEHIEIEQIGVLQKWWSLFQRFLWPIVIMLILVIFAIVYSLLIYFLIPDDAIAELVTRPSMIIIAILYTVLLVRTNAILPKIQKQEKSEAENETEIIEDDEAKEEIHS